MSSLEEGRECVRNGVELYYAQLHHRIKGKIAQIGQIYYMIALAYTVIAPFVAFFALHLNAEQVHLMILAITPLFIVMQLHKLCIWYRMPSEDEITKQKEELTARNMSRTECITLLDFFQLIINDDASSKDIEEALLSIDTSSSFMRSVTSTYKLIYS